MTIHRKRRKSPGGNRGSDSRKNLVIKLLPTRDTASRIFNTYEDQLRLACAALTVEELEEWLEMNAIRVCLEQSEAQVSALHQTGQSRTSYQESSEKDAESHFGKEAA
jgi:hypothetical protein